MMPENDIISVLSVDSRKFLTLDLHGLWFTLSIMTDQWRAHIPFDNIRGLLQDFTTLLDDRITAYRKGTRYEKVRRSDVRVFISATRKAQSVTDIARELEVSRQAVHSSVKRLAELKVVELVPQPGSNRDKLVIVTDRGQLARVHALEQIEQLDKECAAIIGEQGLETFRKLLLALVLGFKAKDSSFATDDPSRSGIIA
jgi:DNA-binding MarR family transcriptional regulator